MDRFTEKLTPFMVMDILSRARQLPDAVHMEVGEPDIPPSERVIEAYQRAIRNGMFHYTPAGGLPELREKISEYYGHRYGLTVPVERIIITPGTSGAFLVALYLTTSAERPLCISDPSYPCYKNFSYFLGAEPVMIPIGKENNYQIRPSEIPDPSGVGALLISSPSNPTGNIYESDNLAALTELSEKEGFYLISDEIYHGLVYEKSEDTALRFSERAIVINGFSKYFCMPGFRVGWMILPEDLVRQAEIIIQNIFIAANTPAQYAALEAFDEGHLESVRAEYRRRRDMLYNGLSDIFDIDAEPDGAFYIWADISQYSTDSVQFSEELLEKVQVAVTPGVDFGSHNTRSHIRLAYTRKGEELSEGISRIRSFLGV